MKGSNKDGVVLLSATSSFSRKKLQGILVLALCHLFMSKLSDCAGDCVWNHFNDNLLSTGYRIKYKLAGITVLGTEETGMQGEGIER